MTSKEQARLFVNGYIERGKPMMASQGWSVNALPSSPGGPEVTAVKHVITIRLYILVRREHGRWLAEIPGFEHGWALDPNKRTAIRKAKANVRRWFREMAK